MNEPTAPRRPAMVFKARARQWVLIAALKDDEMQLAPFDAVPFGPAALAD